MSALEDKILKICEQMFKVYEAGQLSGVNVREITEKIDTLPLIYDTSTGYNIGNPTITAGVIINTEGLLESEDPEKVECYHYTGISEYVGQKVHISGACRQTAPLYLFKDKDGNVIDKGWGNGEIELTLCELYGPVEIPKGAEELYVNISKESYPTTGAGATRYKQKFLVEQKFLSDALQTMISAKGVNTEYIWYANVDAVAKTSNPIVKIGTMADCKTKNCIYTILSASGIIGNIVTMDLTAKTVDAIVSAGDFSKFHNGDLLLYAGGYEGVEAWRWIPQAEAKEDRDGWESAWDKQQVNKVPGIESMLEHMPKEITFHTEAALINWISTDGIHYIKVASGNSANPVVGTTKQSYMVYVGREFNGSDFTGKRFQLAHHLATNRYFYRIGTVASGDSFGNYAWKEITS